MVGGGEYSPPPPNNIGGSVDPNRIGLIRRGHLIDHLRYNESYKKLVWNDQFVHA